MLSDGPAVVLRLDPALAAEFVLALTAPDSNAASYLTPVSCLRQCPNFLAESG